MELLKDVRIDVAPFTGDSGVCPDDERVVEAINNARRIIYPLGHWKNTTDAVCIVPYCGVITLPPEYEYGITGYSSTRHVMVDNNWFTRLVGNWEDYCGSEFNLVQQPGEYVTFRDWPLYSVPRKSTVSGCCAPEGFYVKVIPESDKDCQLEITFQGQGVKLREFSLTRVLDTAWHPLGARPGEIPMAALHRVIKPITHGRIRVYGYDNTNELLMAIYEPQEINPQYTRYSTPSSCRGLSNTVVVKVKKRFRKLLDEPDQFVDIHTDALIHVLQAISERANRNLPGFNANMAMATGFLNKELSGPQSTITSPIQMSRAYRVEGLIT